MSNICINTTRLIHVYRLKASCFSSVRSQKETPAKTKAILLPLWSLLHSLKESQEVDGTTCFVEWTLSAQKTAFTLTRAAPSEQSEGVCAFGLVRNYL